MKVNNRATAFYGMAPDTVVRSDEALMTDMAEGDTAALGQLYLRHSQAVRAMIGYVAPGMSSHDVDDVTQEVFLSLGKAARSYHHQAMFKAFLFRIASNRARDWLRRSWIRGRFARHDDLKIMSSPAAELPGQQTILSQTIRQILESLSYHHREVLVLNVIQGLTCDEIAEVLNIRPKTVRTRLHRARAAVLQHRHAPIWKEAISETTP